MNRLGGQAADLRVGYQLGLVTRKEVIEWADGVIAGEDDPPYDVIELALMSKAHPEDILGRLHALSPGASTVSVLPRVLGKLSHRLRENPALGSTVARALWGIYVESGYDVPSALNPICCFDDGYALAVDGVYGSEEEVFRDLLAFVESFSDTA